MEKLEVMIDDRLWPKLQLTAVRTSVTGAKNALSSTWIYDGAYSQFENVLHNQLRPMVESLVKRRLGR